MDKQKAGIWYRDGSTVYLLQEDGSIQRDGYPELENKFYATVYSRIGVTSEEREAVAELFAAAPETAAERDRLKIELDRLLEREKLCATQGEAMLRAAVQCMQEVSEVVGLTVQNSPADIAAAVRALGSERDRLREIVHPLLANAELFNRGTDEDWVALKNKAQAALAETHPYRPDAERDRLRKALEIIRNGQYTYAGIRDIADAALAGTPPPRPDAGQVNAELLGVLNRLRDGLLNLQENAKNRGDRYDVGYVGAMIEHATAAIAKAEEASQ
jgi:hypothetical protein